MRADDVIEIGGTSYTAVPYAQEPVDTFTQDDKQCQICALMPSYCKLQYECHSERPFILVKTMYVKAMRDLGL